MEELKVKVVEVSQEKEQPQGKTGVGKYGCGKDRRIDLSG